MFVQTNQPALAECLSMVTFYMKHEKTNMNILTVVERGSSWGVAAIQRCRTDGDDVLAQGGDAADPVKCPEEPFEPTPPHNQTMPTNATVKAVVIPTCPPANRWGTAWG